MEVDNVLTGIDEAPWQGTIMRHAVMLFFLADLHSGVPVPSTTYGQVISQLAAVGPAPILTMYA